MPAMVLGSPKGCSSRRELVEQHAEREEVAARIAAIGLQLLGRHVGRRARSEVLLLGEEIGIVRVAREAEVDEHGLARWPQDEVLRLEIEMDDVLLVHAVHGVGERRTDARHLLRCERRTLGACRERRAVDPFHRDVRRGGEITGGHEPRHVASREGGQDHELHLEAHDAEGRLAHADRRHLHDDGKAGVAPGLRGHAIDESGAALVDAIDEREAVDHDARCETLHQATRTDDARIDIDVRCRARRGTRAIPAARTHGCGRRRPSRRRRHGRT